MPDEDPVSKLSALLKNLWPTASQERCISTAEHLAPYPMERVIAVIHSFHGTTELMPEVRIIAEVRARCPEIAQGIARQRRHFAGDTESARTSAQIERLRQEAGVRYADREKIDARLEACSDAQLEALKPQAIERVLEMMRKETPGLTAARQADLAAFYSRHHPRRDPVLKWAIAELLKQGVRPPVSEPAPEPAPEQPEALEQMQEAGT